MLCFIYVLNLILFVFIFPYYYLLILWSQHKMNIVIFKSATCEEKIFDPFSNRSTFFQTHTYHIFTSQLQSWKIKKWNKELSFHMVSVFFQKDTYISKNTLQSQRRSERRTVCYFIGLREYIVHRWINLLSSHYLFMRHFESLSQPFSIFILVFVAFFP